MYSACFKKMSCLVSLLGIILLQVFPGKAYSLVKIDDKSVNLAIKYGLQNQNMGYYALLGPNWMEGDHGTLLNIYTPFMELAAKAAQKGGFSENPTDEDIKQARKKHQREITYLTDPNQHLKIKFAISLYGDSPDFANGYDGWIEGFGRGKAFRIKPMRSVRQKVATLESGSGQSGNEQAGGGKTYDAINSYYFPFEDLEMLDDYKFNLQGPDGTIQVFRINNKSIY